MRKIVCYILCLFLLGSFLPGFDESFAATGSIRYISNRIKIQRPETPGKQQLPAQKAGEKEIVTVPVGKEEKAATGQGAPGESSQTMAELTKEEQNELFLGSQGRFYTRQGKVDPFRPFLRVPEAQVSESDVEKLHIRPPQTPLERYDLSQLKLTAILHAPGKIRALIQEASGKGYIVSEGTYMGNKGGQVSKILNDRIVVEEKYLDVLGNVAAKDIELKIRQTE